MVWSSAAWAAGSAFSITAREIRGVLAQLLDVEGVAGGPVERRGYRVLCKGDPMCLCGLNERFRVLVGRLARGATEQSMIVRGLRGVGKTALLNELTPHTGLAGELARDTQIALSRLKLTAKMLATIRGALGQLQSIKLSGPEGIGLSIDLRRADEATLASDLTQLFLQLGHAAREAKSAWDTHRAK